MKWRQIKELKTISDIVAYNKKDKTTVKEGLNNH